MGEEEQRRAIRGLLAIIAGVSVLMAFHAVGLVFLQGWALDLGSLQLPAPRHGVFLLLWTTLGAAATAAIAIGLALRLDPDAVKIGGTDRQWLIGGSVAALVVPALIHLYVLGGLPLTDDDSAYRLSAELLASGRLTADSHPLKLFFDRAFVINDGRLYTQYFLGWPALLAPFAAVGLAGAANPVYAALTVPALFGVLRRAAGPLAARIGVLLFVSSPMMMIAAATGMSHTSCVMALAWCAWAALRSAEDDAPWWVHGVVGGAFALAFFIRPLSALGAGLPLLAWWAWHLRGRSGWWRAGLAFALPSGLLAAAFFAVNAAQNGSPLTVSYQAMVHYAADNGYRFSQFRPDTDVQMAGFRFYGPVYMMATQAIAAVRLNHALLGWPLSLMLVPLAFGDRRVALLHASWISFFMFSAFQYESGVDSFGPVHYFEAGLGLLACTAVGAATLHRRLANLGGWASGFGVALVFASVGCAVVGYLPVRLHNVARIAGDVGAPFAAVEDAGLERAVVFAPRPFAPGCRSDPTRHWVFWRPNNDPDNTNPILWVNHVDVSANRELMQHFPDRPGFVMVWDEACDVQLLPLDELGPDDVPPANQVLAPTG